METQTDKANIDGSGSTSKQSQGKVSKNSAKNKIIPIENGEKYGSGSKNGLNQRDIVPAQNYVSVNQILKEEKPTEKSSV